MTNKQLTTRYGNLRDGRSVERPLDALHALVEDPRDAVGLDEDCAVADAEAEADANPETRTRPDVWRSEDDEGHAVTAEDACQQHVAQFASRRLYHGRLVVSKLGRSRLLISN